MASMVSPRRARATLVAALAALLILPATSSAADDRNAFAGAGLTGAAAQLAAAAAAPPPGFQETVALSGLTNPTAVRFAPDGRIFVAEKGGRIKVFDDFGDPTPTIYADLSVQVHDFWDRGLLGLALDPQFATRPYVYVLYAYNKDPNSTQFPRWGDSCPTPPGATADGCVVTGRLSRLNGGSEEVLIEDWCQQYPSHSMGSLAFGNDGALYVSAGDGASFNFADYGQDGSPRNPCGDPPAAVGGAVSPPTAEGGALRSQDVRTPADPTSLDGAILRLDPNSGAAMAGNPNAASPDPNARRIVAYGLRNPFRFTMRPGTNEVWTGDVGWNAWEEINRVPNPTGEVRNFGWPCYEGTGRMGSYDNLNLSLCENLYSQGAGAHAAPYYTYNHASRVVTGETCGTGSSAISGLAFTPPGSSFPVTYNGALFFSDYSRDCIWAMLAGANGLPDPNNRQTFVAGASNPVELQFGPGGDLYYVDLDGGNIRRIRSLTANRAPIARATATPSTGSVPLTVAFDGSTSSDPDGTAITYAWDLDGDGAFDDSTAVAPSFTYTATGTYTARLRVRDPGGLEDTVNVPITAGSPPVPIINITSPTPGTTWEVDDTIAFSGTATDFQGNPIPASGLTWDINLEHCDRVSGSCHTHPLQSFGGVAGGSFPAPDHEFPSYLEIELTARDGAGLTGTATRRLDPDTVPLTLASDPPGMRLTLGAETATAPFTREVIKGSTNGIGAESPQTLGGLPYTFSSWSNAGARNHTTVVDAATTLTATFERTTALKLGGADVIGSNISGAGPGGAEVYRFVATNSGTATELNLYVASSSTASDLVLGVYSDVNGTPTARLGSGRIANPAEGAWNKVPVNVPGLEAGKSYWFSLLNPADGTGTLRWHDRAGGSGGAEQTHGGGGLTQLPATWTTGGVYSDGPVSGYAFGSPAGPPPPPNLSVSPTSLSFSGTAGAANPAARTISVANTGGGTLSFTASDDASWLTVTPGTGTAPRDLSVAANTAGLTAGTHTATVRVESAGVDGSPRLIPVTLTLDPAPPPVLSVSPASLSFSATVGAASPAAQNLTVANTGSGTLSFSATDDTSWLAVTPGSGDAPATLSVAVSSAGLRVGTYSGAVTVAAAGANGSPATIPVTLVVGELPPPTTGLVGAWGFDEASGTTANDTSGAGNPGTIAGPTRTAGGRYGGALSFDGVNDLVTVADAPSLDLTTGMTLEAWVRPTVGGDWKTVMLKEQPGHLAYALYSSTDTGRPSGHVFAGGDRAVGGPAALPNNAWSHLATTWDGLTSRLYVNGTQVASGALTGTAATSSLPLRIGGNTVWSEWFGGLIDEVRVYNRALSPAEIANDHDTAIGGGGT
jgi:glucose/arabinose dehydrogenase/PKD repeat protein